MDVKEFRTAGHQVVDLLAEYLENIESKPVFPDADPKLIVRLFTESLPQNPESFDDVLGELQQKLLPYCTHVGHPGYMGLITPSPNPVGVIGDFICSALNQNLGVYSIEAFGGCNGETDRALACGSCRLRQAGRKVT